MDGDQQAFVACFKWVIIAILGLSIITASSCQLTNLQIARSVAAGADVLDAACAFDSQSSPNCVLRYAE